MSTSRPNLIGPQAIRSAACALVMQLVMLLVMLVLPAAASAQGWVEPRPGPQHQRWGIEKLRTTVNVSVSGRVATVEVEEWFRNNGHGLGEGDYVYPLPGDAVFTGYSLYQGEDELRGEMMDAARARAIYERIVQAQRDPALIELIGKGMIRARVFPIEAGQTRRITLRYTQVLESAGDALHFRYAAGVRHAGHARRPSVGPGAREAAPLLFTLVTEDGARFRDAFSPTHRVRVERERGRMTVRPRDEIAGDFAVFLPFAEKAVGVSLATHRPADENGYFMLTLSPGEVAAARVPRDLTVVIDVSGSMSGEKMEQARRAVQQLLGTLTPSDRLRLVAFSSRVSSWRDGWAAATGEDLRSARSWVDDLRADGGTNIHGALDLAFRAESPASRLPIVVFMTDGLPTVGETRTERIAELAESSRGRARVFAFGVGYDVNTDLLDRLSEAARGSTQYVRPNEDVEEAVSLLATKIRHPVLTDLTLERGPVRLTEVYPRELPDLFAGEELVVFGRYEGSGQGDLAVRGRRDGRTERYAAAVRFPARDGSNDYVPRLWASRKLGDLDRRIRSARADGASRGQTDELVEELRQTALRYGLLSEYTAYLVEEPPVVAAGHERLQIAPTTFSADGAAAPSSASFTGKVAVERAEAARRAREVTSMADIAVAESTAGSAAGAATGNPADGARRIIGGRTFTLRAGTWEDTRASDGMRVVNIEPYSPAYFALVRALPELAFILRQFDRVRVVGERVVIGTGAGGVQEMSQAEVRAIVAQFRSRT